MIVGVDEKEYERIVDIITLTLEDHVVKYGVRIRSEQDPQPTVMAFDCKKSPLALLWKKSGYAARSLDIF